MQWGYVAVAALTFSFFDALYIGAQFGSGPRDGLITGIMRITGKSAGTVRTVLEVSVVLVGILLGGQFGPGTIVLAFIVGPIIGFFLPKVTIKLHPVAHIKHQSPPEH